MTQQSTTSLPAVILAGAAACGLCFMTEPVTLPLRNAVRDALRPGQLWLAEMVEDVKRVARQWGGGDVPSAQGTTETTAENRFRRLQIRNALLHEQLQRRKSLQRSPHRGDKSPPAFSAHLLQARVLGEETSALWRGGFLLDRGQQHGLRERDLVLRDDGLLIDVGEDRVERGFPVYAGRCVLGRIQQVGRWTSTVHRVTDASFRGRAQLIRRTAGGYVFGATGVMEGTGEGRCRLTLIPPSEPVAVGDDVYTLSDGGVFPVPMFYGKVVQTELPENAAHWKILVKPAAADSRPRSVQILRKRLKP